MLYQNALTGVLVGAILLNISDWLVVIGHCLLMWTTSSIHREIMPLGIALACTTWCHSAICQSGERRMSGHLYTVTVGYQIKAYTTLCQPLSPVFARSHYKVTDDTLESFVADSDVIAWVRPELPQCTNARSSSSLHSGRCHCGIKWHKQLLSWVAQFPCVLHNWISQEHQNLSDWLFWAQLNILWIV